MYEGQMDENENQHGWGVLYECGLDENDDQIRVGWWKDDMQHGNGYFLSYTADGWIVKG